MVALGEKIILRATVRFELGISPDLRAPLYATYEVRIIPLSRIRVLFSRFANSRGAFNRRLGLSGCDFWTR